MWFSKLRMLVCSSQAIEAKNNLMYCKATDSGASNENMFGYNRLDIENNVVEGNTTKKHQNANLRQTGDSSIL